MTRFRSSFAVVAMLVCVAAIVAVPTNAVAQKDNKPKTKKSDSAGVRLPKPETAIPPLFASESPLAVTFTTNVKQLRGDRGETSPWRNATMTYVGGDGKTVTVPMRAKTHGIWRLKHCSFPPLRLNVSNKEAKGTLFYDLQKPKFVNACNDRDNFEQLLLQEMQLYRVYHLLTPMSHRVRTLRVKYADSSSGKDEATRYAFLFEDPDELADRIGGAMMKVKGAGGEDIEPEQAALVYLFQFMIGNTDFSFNGLHNGELVQKPDGSPVLPIAYDFDFSGAVNAPYATVDPRLPIKRVRDRIYRGYCVLKPEIPAAVERFKQKKAAIYALYSDDVGKLLDQRVVRETLDYFDGFYAAISSQRDVDDMLRSCVGSR
ncbi:MAG: hypothetical protein ABJE10_12915 [bacterium]